MAKKKISKSVTKRFKVTKTGKVMFEHQYNSHHKSIKSNRRIRRHKEPAELTGLFAKKIKQMIGEV